MQIKNHLLRYGVLLFVGIGAAIQPVQGKPAICKPVLWPNISPVNHPELSIPASHIEMLEQWSKKLVHQLNHPLPELHSAGKITPDDPELLASRLAMQDAGKIAVLALTYRLTKNKVYFNHTKQTLLDWARVNQPTGHPIDETKLDGMIWAYDLIACELAPQDKHTILHWFDTMWSKKNAWIFTPMTRTNNHRIHQIKMLLLLDKILQRGTDGLRETRNAAQYAQINLDPKTGKSVDYIQRHALFYHNYDVQAWLEISLLSDCCHTDTDQAFAFLRQKIITQHIGNEFTHSQVKLDQHRAQQGFAYAKAGGKFDIRRAAPTIVTYYTLHATQPDPKLWKIVEDSPLSPWLVFLKARRLLWQSTQM